MENTATQIDLRAYAHQAMSYPAYRSLIDDALARDKTTGDNHSPDMLSYTRMNVQRMNRLDKQVQIDPALAALVQGIKKPLLWLVLTEAWCGDAAQNLPLLQQLALQQPHIELGLLLRDEHLPLMDAFLTNGGRSIPKLIIVDPENGALLGSWGPRPQAAQVLYMDLKAQGLPYLEASTALHKWYAQDKTASMQAELLALLQGMAL
jgi:hypothetical protein